jgi:hypothetical protein
VLAIETAEALGGFDPAPFLSDPDPLIRAAAQ